MRRQSDVCLALAKNWIHKRANEVQVWMAATPKRRVHRW